MCPCTPMGLLSRNSDLGRCLVRRGAIRPDQLELAKQSMERSGGRLPAHLIALNHIDEDTLIEHLADEYDLPVLGPDSVHADYEALKLVDSALLEDRSFVPLRQIGKTLTVAITDPSDRALLARLKRDTGLKVRAMIAPASAVRSAIDRLVTLADLENHPDRDLIADYAGLLAALSDYRFVDTIAQGGFGNVFRMHQISLNRSVALKVLDREWTALEEITVRFEKEGAIIASLDHPNIVKVYEQGAHQGTRYIIMEYFAGKPMNDAMKGKDLVTKLSGLRGVCSALGYAHAQGVIHRDIKPGNILLNEKGQVKLLDFGVARVESSGGETTKPQVVIGTPRYMAPELHTSAVNASPQSDVYAFGVMAYEVLLEKRCQSGELVHPSRQDPRIATHLGQAILQCLHPSAERRPKSFEALSEIIQGAIDHLLIGTSKVKSAAESAPKAKATLPAAKRPEPSKTDGQGREREQGGGLGTKYEFRLALRDDDYSRTSVAFHTELDRQVIIKQVDKGFKQSSLHAIMKARSEHIGEVFVIGKDGVSVIVVREYFGAGNLAERLKDTMELDVVLDTLFAVVEALRVARKSKLSHGNLNSHNVLFGKNGTIKVVDFGLGIESQKIGSNYRSTNARKENSKLVRGDEFALGAMAFEMFTGERFNPKKHFEESFAVVQANKSLHPLMKYFLGRLWRLPRYEPAYVGYDDILMDLERMRSRLAAQAELSAAQKEDLAPRAGRRSPFGRALDGLASMITKTQR